MSDKSNEKLHVMIDFNDEKVQSLQQVDVTNEGNDRRVLAMEIKGDMAEKGCKSYHERGGYGCEEGVEGGVRRERDGVRRGMV